MQLYLGMAQKEEVEVKRLIVKKKRPNLNSIEIFGNLKLAE